MLVILITLAYDVGMPAGPRFTTAAVITGLMRPGSINRLTPAARSSGRPSYAATGRCRASRTPSIGSPRRCPRDRFAASA